MIKYYTRACNFIYGHRANQLIKEKRALPLCGNKYIAFSSIEVFERKNDKTKKKFLDIKKIKKLNKIEKKKVLKDIKKISVKRKNFLKNVNFKNPSIMGILNLTPDSFSDGGKFNKESKSFKHINYMVKSGAKIIDIGGESTRPGSIDTSLQNELKRIERVFK